MKIYSRRKRCRRAADFMSMRILHVSAFLKPGIVLLESIAGHRVVEKVREVRVQVEQRSANEAIHLERIAIGEALVSFGLALDDTNSPL